MADFFQSSLFHALGCTIICNVVQGAFVWALLTAINKYYITTSLQRYYAAFAAQVFCLFLFVVSLGYFSSNNIGELGYSVSTASWLVASFKWMDKIVLPFIAQLYLVIFLLQLIRFIRDIIWSKRFRLFVTDNKNVLWQRFIDEKSEELSIKKQVNLKVSSFITSPAVIGFLKPVILLPLSAINQLSCEQMEAVLMHELAHIKRADYLIHLVQAIIQKILVFNPFALLISKIMEAERENACDDWVLMHQYNKFNYAEALYKLAAASNKTSIAVFFSANNDKQLLNRITRILTGNNEKKNNSSTYSLVSLALAAIIFVSMFISMPAQTLKPFAENVAKTSPLKSANFNKNVIRQGDHPMQFAGNHSTQIKKAEPVIAILAKKATQLKPVNSVTAATVNNSLPGEESNASTIFAIAVADSTLSFKNKVYNAQNTTVNLNLDQYKKMVSYSTFQNIEAMLAATGDSCVSVKESPLTKDSYKRLLTINSMNKNGDKHTYTIVIELYQ